jgi:hypothetical protein
MSSDNDYYEARRVIADRFIPSGFAIDRFRFIYGEADEILLKHAESEDRQAAYERTENENP